MSWWQAFILGVLQGIAEFLPISSSGHLLLLREMFGLSEVPKLFDILLHVATLAVVIFYFRKRIGVLLVAFFYFVTFRKRKEDKESLRLILWIIISTIATFPLAYLFDEMGWGENLFITGVAFIGTGFLLLGSLLAKGNDSIEKITAKHSILIGIAQSIGTLPGVSRSGITIAIGRFTSLNPKAASEFSFIISIPAILGALILKIKDAGDLMGSVDIFPLLLSVVITIITGYFALTGLMKLIEKKKLYLFSFYLIPLGISVLLFF